MKANLVLSVLVLGVTVNAPVAFAQSVGQFTVTGSMSTPRVSHTATLLLDGRVLIAGGYLRGNGQGGDSWLASAELYDPFSGTFTPTGNMSGPRSAHRATLLPDGKVLITGGARSSDSVSDLYIAGAELYDPSSGTFTTTGDMTVGRATHTATLLSTGKVLITGGAYGDAASTAELYNCSTGTFSLTGKMNGALYGHFATLLPDGKVLIIPGDEAQNLDWNNAEIYDPHEGFFKLASVAPEFLQLQRGFAPATVNLLMNGSVLVTTGFRGGGLWTSHPAALYDSSTGTFAATTNTVWGIWQATGTTLSDGTVLVAGGNLGGGFSGAELYDPSSARFSPTGDMVVGRVGHTATLLSNGDVLMAGGYAPHGCQPPQLASAEIYHPAVLRDAAPVLFSLSGDGRGQGAILHANTRRVASSGDPAVAGEALEIYLTGLTDGSVLPPQVAVGGRMAEVLYFGKSGYGGLNQVNVRVPGGVNPGPALPVRLTYIGRPSNEVTIGVR